MTKRQRNIDQGHIKTQSAPYAAQNAYRGVQPSLLLGYFVFKHRVVDFDWHEERQHGASDGANQVDKETELGNAHRYEGG